MAKKLKNKYKGKFKKIGKWCNEIKGRLPYPIECQTYQDMCKLHPKCKDCTRYIVYKLWREGEYTKIEKAIEDGDDFTKDNFNISLAE